MLKLPGLLKSLIDQGVWPREGQNANDQEFNPIIPKEAVEKVFPGNSKLILMPPPYCTITEEKNSFYTENISCVGQILYDRAVCIADFGAGSDSPVILYYQSSDDPCVMYLRWHEKELGVMNQDWIKSHDSFEEFVQDIGLI
jgi:hypothetical protein